MMKAWPYVVVNCTFPSLITTVPSTTFLSTLARVSVPLVNPSTSACFCPEVGVMPVVLNSSCTYSVLLSPPYFATNACYGSDLTRAGGLGHTLRPGARSSWRNDLLFQSLSKHLSHVIDKHKPNVFEGFLGNFIHVSPILLRQYYRGNPSATGGKNFLLHAADGKHVSPQRDFTSHRNILPYRSPRERRNHCRRQRDAGGWSIFWNRPLGNVNMKIIITKVILVDLQLFRARLGI